MNSLHSSGPCGTWCLEFFERPRCPNVRPLQMPGWTIIHPAPGCHIPSVLGPCCGTWRLGIGTRSLDSQWPSEAPWTCWVGKPFFFVVESTWFCFWFFLPSDFVICKKQQHVTSLFLTSDLINRCSKAFFKYAARSLWLAPCLLLRPRRYIYHTVWNVDLLERFLFDMDMCQDFGLDEKMEALEMQGNIVT